MLEGRQAIVASAFVREGVLYLSRRSLFEERVQQWPNCQAVVRLEQVLDPRSAALNAYYWAVPIWQISEHTGMTPREAHDEMKALHLPPGLHALRGGAVCGRCARVIDGSTRFLSGREEWLYIEAIQRWAAQTIDLVIPDPELV